MAVHVDLTLDCADPVAQAEFWKTALGYEDEPPPAPFATREEWLESLPDLADDGMGGEWLHDPAGIGPRLSLLQVPEGKTAKNRLHIDLRVSRGAADGPAAVAATAERLRAAGATVLVPSDGHHVVMADPEGNEFCVA